MKDGIPFETEKPAERSCDRSRSESVVLQP